MTIKSTIAALAISATSLIFSSCSLFDGKSKLEKGTSIASTEQAVKAVTDNQEANNGKRFSVIGYLYYKPGFAVYMNRPQIVTITTEQGNSGSVIAHVDIPWGKDDPNSVWVDTDLERDEANTVFYDNEGKPLSMKDKVSVTFEVDQAAVNPNKVRIDRAQ